MIVVYLLAFQFGYSFDNAKDLWKLNISENQSCVGCFPRRFYGQVNLSEQYRSDTLSYFLGKSCRFIFKVSRNSKLSVAIICQTYSRF